MEQYLNKTKPYLLQKHITKLIIMLLSMIKSIAKLSSQKTALKNLLLFMVVLFSFQNAFAGPCGADIYILNDNSGSVDANELRQSREFITRIALEFAPLGTANDQTRIAISNFADRGTFTEYDFPHYSIGRYYILRKFCKVFNRMDGRERCNRKC